MEIKQKPETTTLVVTREVRDYLDSKGVRNETFDEIIRRLLNINNDNKKTTNQKDRTTRS